MLASFGSFQIALLAALAGPPQGVELGARTEHLTVTYPAQDDSAAREFLAYAEAVYADVDSLLSGALPGSLEVELVRQGTSGLAADGVTLSLHHGRRLDAIFAAVLAQAAAREVLAGAHELDAYHFLVEGLAGWAAERYERRLGVVEPRGLWAAYAFLEEAAYLEFLSSYDEAEEELGHNVVAAAGYSLISYLVERGGLAALHALLLAMRDNVDLCTALDDAGLDCARCVEGWRAALEAEVARHDFSTLPEMWSALEVWEDGGARDLWLVVHVHNPEAADYEFFVSYVIGDERFEESHAADASHFQTFLPLGRVTPGAHVLWEVAVWSRTIQTWRKSGWQDQIVR
jgi:hypothetical protein